MYLGICEYQMWRWRGAETIVDALLPGRDDKVRRQISAQIRSGASIRSLILGFQMHRRIQTGDSLDLLVSSRFRCWQWRSYCGWIRVHGRLSNRIHSCVTESALRDGVQKLEKEP